MTASFIRPVHLPSEVTFEARRLENGQVDFTVSALEGGKVCLKGRVLAIDDV